MKSKTGIISLKMCRARKQSSSSPLLSLSKRNVKLIPKARSSTNGSGSGVKPAVQHTSLTASSATSVHYHQLVSTTKHTSSSLFFCQSKCFQPQSCCIFFLNHFYCFLLRHKHGILLPHFSFAFVISCLSETFLAN